MSTSLMLQDKRAPYLVRQAGMEVKWRQWPRSSSRSAAQVRSPPSITTGAVSGALMACRRRVGRRWP